MNTIKAGSITFPEPGIAHIVLAETTKVIEADILGYVPEKREIYLRQLVHDGKSERAGPFEIHGAVSSIITVPAYMDFPPKV